MWKKKKKRKRYYVPLHKSVCTDHYPFVFLESQSHRMVWVEKDVYRPTNSKTCSADREFCPPWLDHASLHSPAQLHEDPERWWHNTQRCNGLSLQLLLVSMGEWRDQLSLGYAPGQIFNGLQVFPKRVQGVLSSLTAVMKGCKVRELPVYTSAVQWTLLYKSVLLYQPSV